MRWIKSTTFVRASESVSRQWSVSTQCPGEPAVPEGESYTFHPPAPSLPRQALFPWPYDEPLRFTTR